MLKVFDCRLSVCFVLLCCRIKKSPKLLLRVGQPQAMCQCWHLPCSTRTAQHNKPHKTKPNRRRQGNPAPPTTNSIPYNSTYPSCYFASFSFQARTVRCKHSAVAAPNFTNNSRLPGGWGVWWSTGNGSEHLPQQAAGMRSISGRRRVATHHAILTIAVQQQKSVNKKHKQWNEL